MALYKYKAKDSEGKVYEKTIDVENRHEIYSIIRNEGASIISISEVKHINLSAISLKGLFSSISTNQKIIFAKNLGHMMKAGLPLTRALAVMNKQSKNKAFKRIISSIESDISHGKTLSDSLSNNSKTFSTLFVSMVRAGEESGKVSEALGIIAGQMEKSHALVKKVRGAMIYPSIIILVMVILSITLLIFMVPTLTETFEGLGATLPLSTRVIIYLSDFLVQNTLLVLSFVIVLFGATILFIRSRIGHRLLDYVSLRIPVIGGMMREFESAQTARTLSSLLSSGVEIVSAIDVTADVIQNHLYKNILKKARKAVEKGELMSAVISEDEKLYPVFVSEMVAVGEETGQISEMLDGVADYYEVEVDQKTKNLSTIIEPVLMVIIGIGVGIFAFSMLAPTYSLVDYI